MRAAIYFTPPADAPLTKAAADWLGWDAFSASPTRKAHPAIDAIVHDPARYGFHATLRAPFRLADGRDLSALDEALAAFAKARRGFVIPQLALSRLGDFFALVPRFASDEIRQLEGAVVRAFEPFRAPLTEAEIARRMPDRLTERQRRYIDEWGYPYVLDEFRFHMTLTSRIPARESADVMGQLSERFGEFAEAPLRIDGLALFVEPAPGEPFRVHSRHPFQTNSQR
ncbi:DUF1045 domain-containing protein [Aquamicrobium sp. LC103]|uniref:DUF1045 domain-containing protein n=1 Tax=Aquamicrobium sp. LC103 TaxID=1120658 RepID=UPI00063EB57B|nr:DUF1045 domain-containing protein [Aquamicrobium sp. LC103]TKT74658.1 DUF1045 domain-containing protein [Aquamicrobium sp. LC103]